MKLPLLCAMSLCLLAAPAFAKDPEWAVDISVIEACSCPMFCQCYFNSHPASHHGEGAEMEHFCKFNNAYKINSGHYGDVDLTGAMVWAAGDLGAAEFTEGRGKWLTIAFDKDTTPEQREAIGTIFGHIIPFQWGQTYTTEGDITMEWNDDQAVALLDAGKTGEVRLQRNPTANPGAITVIEGLQYWGLPTNDGFVLMPNTIEAYRGSEGMEQYEFTGTNGFMLHFRTNSEEIAAHQAAMKAKQMKDGHKDMHEGHKGM